MPKEAMTTEKNQGRIADLLLVGVALVWGMGFPVTQMAIDAQLSAGIVVALRFWVAALVLGLAFWRELRTLTLQEVKYSAIAGVILSAAFLLQVAGQQFTTPSNSAFLTSTNVVIVPFLSWVFFKQRPSRKLLLVSLSCLAGAAMLTISPGKGLQLNPGDALTLLCAVAFSLHIAYLGTAASRLSAQKLSFVQTLTAAVVGTLYSLLFEPERLAQCDLRAGIFPILYLGLLSTAFAFFAQTYAQRHTSPTKAAIILGTEGLLGSIFSVLLGYEPLTANLVVGGLVIFCSLLAMEVDIPALRGKKRG